MKLHRLKELVGKKVKIKRDMHFAESHHRCSKQKRDNTSPMFYGRLAEVHNIVWLDATEVIKHKGQTVRVLKQIGFSLFEVLTQANQRIVLTHNQLDELEAPKKHAVDVFQVQVLDVPDDMRFKPFRVTILCETREQAQELQLRLEPSLKQIKQCSHLDTEGRLIGSCTGSVLSGITHARKMVRKVMGHCALDSDM